MNNLTVQLQLGDILPSSTSLTIYRTVYWSQLTHRSISEQVTINTGTLIAHNAQAQRLLHLPQYEFVVAVGSIWKPGKVGAISIDAHLVAHSLPQTDVNHISLVGRLGDDPTVPDKIPNLTRLSLASNKPGERDAYPTWFTCECWNSMAQRAKSYGKGDMLSIEGELQVHYFVDSETRENRSSLKVIVSKLDYLAKSERAKRREAIASSVE